jgi:NitT/TauT family transport system ATP-binding protein
MENGMTLPSAHNATVAAAPPLVSVEDVSKVFQKVVNGQTTSVTALSGISFQIREDEFVAIVGASGCGKTTLLRTIAGLEQPTRGRVVVNNQVVSGPGPDRAVVFQDMRLLPWRTCQANVEFGLELQGVPKAERQARALAAITLVGLSGWANYYPSELSGGMQQRVGIARALAVQPEILLMDEPFGALDAITRSQMQQELTRIFLETPAHKTVLFVTHSIDEALVLADRVLVFAKGGTLREDIALSFSRPRNQAELLLDPSYIELKRHLLTLLEPTAPQPKASNEAETGGPHGGASAAL